MDGILNVLKPPGMTSHDVIAYLRRVFKTKKVGHTGTLDPGVPGVLPVCFGKGTRLVEYIQEYDKAYRCRMLLGATTDTLDASGNIVEEKEVNVTREDIIKALNNFVGNIEQVPPMVSAVRHNGKKLYELAREGKVVERKPRPVTIKEIKIIHIDDLPAHSGVLPSVLFDVTCTKGTYIRTLCADIGEILGCGAHMGYLVRTQTGPFKLAEAHTLEEIKAIIENDEGEGLFKKLEDVLPLKRFRATRIETELLSNGRKINLNSGNSYDFGEGEQVQVLSDEGELIAICVAIKDEDVFKLKPSKVFKPA